MSEKKLNPQQQLFVLEYLKDLNATQAAIRAQYSEKTAYSIGSELKNKPEIAAAIQREMDERATRTKIDIDYVLSTIQETVERCKQAEPVMEFNRDTKEMERTGEWKFDSGAVLKGAELLGKHLKMFTDKVEHSGKVTLAELVAGDPTTKDKE